MWRYDEWMPLREGDRPVTLGEGATPMVPAKDLSWELGLSRLWIKDEALNATGSFKARGLSAAITRAALGGAKLFTVPTAGNAGVATSAYGKRAGIPVRVWAPRTTPPMILRQMEVFGAVLELLDGHIGDCGKEAQAYSREHGGFDMSTLREPYRIEGKKTMGLEVAEQLGWTLPDSIVYPTGGGTGLIGMWKAFEELRNAGWIADDERPKLFSVQSTGCAPVVKAYEEGAERPEPWPDPKTVAAGLRVPGPLGGKLILRALKDTGGSAVSVSDEDLMEEACALAGLGIDACPEGGATLAALRVLMERGEIQSGESVVLFNTGAGWLYR
jgi:threonine synthase